MRTTALALAAALLALLVSSATAHAANNVRSLPGCVANELARNDDGSSPAASLGFKANFYGTPWETVYVNNNGNVTFGTPLPTYTPFDFTAAGYQIIAPYLADVDTRGGGLPVTYGAGETGGEKYFCVDWVNVGYFAEHYDKLNSFQLILRQAPAEETSGNFKIEFNYDTIQWETGDASAGQNGFGGTPAAVGFSADDGVPGHYKVFPGSFESGAFEDSNGATGLVNTSNVGVPGHFVFQVGNGAVSGGVLKGTVFQHDGSTPEAEASVQICPISGAECVIRQTNANGEYIAGALTPGTYRVTAYPGTGAFAPGAVKPNPLVKDKETTTQDIVLGNELKAPAGNTSVEADGISENGVPVVYNGQPGKVTAQFCTGATLTFQITDFEGNTLAGGPMTEVPGSAEPIIEASTFVGSYSGLAYDGSAHVSITGKCPKGELLSDQFDIYIDPSGTVVDGSGHAVEGATVTLLRSVEGASGPFVPVPTGNSEMSPANRTNPTVTGAGGRFGWDVVAGYYRIKASKEGCTATSPVLSIPPPANGLVLTLNCGGGGSSGGSSSSSSGSGTTSTSSPPPPAPVAKAATIQSVSAVALRNGSIRVTFKTTGAGTTTITGTARIKYNVKSKHGKHKQTRYKLVKYVSGSAGSQGAQQVSITLAPSSAGKAELRSLKKLLISISVLFKPAAGTTTTLQATSATVRYYPPKKKKKK